MITADVIAHVPLFADASAGQRAAIVNRAADLRLQPGEWLAHEGEAPAFFVLLAGRLDVVKRAGGGDQAILQYGPGDHSGEVALMLSSPAVVSLRASESSRVMRLEANDFYELIVLNPQMSTALLKTMAERTQRLQDLTMRPAVARVTLVGHRRDPECQHLRNFLSRNHVAFAWVDPIDTPGLVQGSSAGPYPHLVLNDGRRLLAPSCRELADHLGFRTQPSAPDYDVVIVGSGPAGLAAGVYGASEGLRTLMIERDVPGGQAGTSSRIENYLGFPSGLSGDELSTRAWQQAQRFGAEILVTRQVTGMRRETERTPSFWTTTSESSAAPSCWLRG